MSVRKSGQQGLEFGDGSSSIITVKMPMLLPNSVDMGRICRLECFVFR